MKNQSREPEYVDDRDLARLTPIKRVTWQQMRARGTGPPWYRLGRRCIYKLADVRAWIEDHVRDRRQRIEHHVRDRRKKSVTRRFRPLAR